MGPRINRALGRREPLDRCVESRRRDALLGWSLVDVREAHLLHRVEVIEIAPEFLKAIGRRQRLGVIAQVVLAELCGRIAQVEKRPGDGRRAGPQPSRASRQLRHRQSDTNGYMPVIKAQRPDVQLCMA